MKEFNYKELKEKYKEIFGREIQFKSDMNNLMLQPMYITARELHELIFEYVWIRGITGDEIDDLEVFGRDLFDYYKRMMKDRYDIESEWLNKRRRKANGKFW
jgi:hypothetical protein